MAVLREKHLDFLEFLKGKTGLTVSAIAKKANISDSTLTRFIRKPEFESLSSTTLDKISKVAGYESYESYLLNEYSAVELQEIKISDAEKFELYESVKRLLAKKYRVASPELVSKISKEVLEDAAKLNTNFISDSLIMYVIEKNELRV